MLDCFEILTTSGVVVWSRSNIPIGANIVNSLINDVFIEEKVRPAATGEEGSSIRHPAYKVDKYTLKYTFVKELGLIFVAVYQSLLHLTWVDKLIQNIRTIFVKLYQDDLKGSKGLVKSYQFDRYYDQQLLELGAEIDQAVTTPVTRGELGAKKETLEKGDNGGPPPPHAADLAKAQLGAASLTGHSASSTPVVTPDTSRPTTPLPSHLVGSRGSPAPRGSRRARKAANAVSAASSGDETRKPKNTRATSTKKMRRWDADGMADEDDGTNLDYSMNNLELDGDDSVRSSTMQPISGDSFGTRTKKGEFVLKDLGDEVNSILAESKPEKQSTNGMVESGINAISGYFRNIVGGKTLTKEDLTKPLASMKDHLIRKNVASEAATRLCESVKSELVGKKTGSFESVETALRAAMESSLRKILTPTSSLDLIHEIQSVTTPTSSSAKPRPYVISIVGVNGVGKSTNLSKIAFFLLQNNYRVLVAACDTFRSGAVEQLNVHVRNLAELSARENTGHVSLYQKGYGKDAANVAKDAINFAASEKYDVVLIDTAGRRHNDTRLMSSLEKFAQFAEPDKIFMVGEALVGNDSVAQARNFNAAFGAGRGLDGFIISKCDTVGDMVGTLVSMVHATGIPVVFLGVGQHYGDLRGLSVAWAVNLLMS